MLNNNVTMTMTGHSVHVYTTPATTPVCVLCYRGGAAWLDDYPGWCLPLVGDLEHWFSLPL